jgi:hypothetical protein
MYLMVHDNGGTPKWWAREGQFGRGDCAWGSVDTSHLQGQEGSTNTTWTDKQKKGYKLAGEVQKLTVDLLRGKVDVPADLITPAIVTELRDLARLHQRPSAGAGYIAISDVADATARRVLARHPELQSVWDGKAQSAPTTDGIKVAPPPKQTVAEMLQQLGKQPATVDAAPANPWEF